MRSQTEEAMLLELDNISELFNAPHVNPFSSHAVDILGEAGIDILQKYMVRRWPFLPKSSRLVLQLPPEQMTPDLLQQTRLALQRYCASKISENKLLRRLTIQVSWRKVILATLFMLLIIFLLIYLEGHITASLSPVLAGIFNIVLIYAGVVALFDAFYSLIFDWVPYFRENMIYRRIHTIEISIEPGHSPD
jgi:hypothetical protein